MADDLVNVRYMVNDVQQSVDWYTTHLGFEQISNAAPAFADVKRGGLRLLLSGEKSSAGARHARWREAEARRLEPDRDYREQS